MKTIHIILYGYDPCCPQNSSLQTTFKILKSLPFPPSVINDREDNIRNDYGESKSKNVINRDDKPYTSISLTAILEIRRKLKEYMMLQCFWENIWLNWEDSVYLYGYDPCTNALSTTLREISIEIPPSNQPPLSASIRKIIHGSSNFIFVVLQSGIVQCYFIQEEEWCRVNIDLSKEHDMITDGCIIYETQVYLLSAKGHLFHVDCPISPPRSELIAKQVHLLANYPADETFKTAAVTSPLNSITSGESHIILWSSRQEVFSAGSNVYGQLGLGKISSSTSNVILTDSKLNVYVIEELCGINITTIDANGWWSSATTESGEALIWGSLPNLNPKIYDPKSGEDVATGASNRDATVPSTISFSSSPTSQQKSTSDLESDADIEPFHAITMSCASQFQLALVYNEDRNKSEIFRIDDGIPKCLQIKLDDRVDIDNWCLLDVICGRWNAVIVAVE